MSHSLRIRAARVAHAVPCIRLASLALLVAVLLAPLLQASAQGTGQAVCGQWMIAAGRWARFYYYPWDPSSYWDGTGFEAEGWDVWSLQGQYAVIYGPRFDSDGFLVGCSRMELTEGCPSPSAEPLPLAEGPPGQIAYVRDSGIWLLDLSSRETSQLIEAETWPPPRTPAWAPDGMRLAYVRSTGEIAVDASTLVTVDLATGAERELAYSNRMLGPAWSPDGETILVACTDDTLERYYRIYTVPAAGTAEAREMDELMPARRATNYPAWSPDGGSVSYSWIDVPVPLLDPPDGWALCVTDLASGAIPQAGDRSNRLRVCLVVRRQVHRLQCLEQERGPGNLALRPAAREQEAVGWPGPDAARHVSGLRVLEPNLLARWAMDRLSEARLWQASGPA